MAAVNASKNRGVEHPVAVPVAVTVKKGDVYDVKIGKLAPVQVAQVPITSPLALRRVKDSAILSAARAKREAANSAIKKADEEIQRAKESVRQAHAEAIRLSKEAKAAKAATKAQEEQTKPFVVPALNVSNPSKQEEAKQKLVQEQKAGEEARKAEVVALEKAAEAIKTLAAANAQLAKAEAVRKAMATPTKITTSTKNEVRRLLVESSARANNASASAGEAAEKGRAISATSAKANTQYKNKESVRTTNAERLSSGEIDRLLQGIQSSNSETKKSSISQLLNIEIVKRQAAEEAVQALSDAEEAANPATIKKVTEDAQEAARKARKDAQEKEAVKVQARNNVKITEKAYHNVGAPVDPQWSQNKETAAQKQYHIALTNSIAANNAADTAAREAVKKEAVAKAREKDELSRLKSAEARVVLKREAVVVTKRIAEEATKAANTARTAAGNNLEMKSIVAKAAARAAEKATLGRLREEVKAAQAAVVAAQAAVVAADAKRERLANAQRARPMSGNVGATLSQDAAHDVDNELTQAKARKIEATARADKAKAALEAARSKSGLLPGTTSASASHNGTQPGTKVTPTVTANELAASKQANEAATAVGNLLKLQKQAKANPSNRKAQEAVAQATPQVEQQLAEAQKAQGGDGRFADFLGRLFLSLALGSSVRSGGKRTRTHKRNHKRKRTHKR